MLEAYAKLAFGVFLMLTGFGYIFRYDIVDRVRAFIRDFLLNDAAIALERRKWGLFFVIMGSVFVYMGLDALKALAKR